MYKYPLSSSQRDIIHTWLSTKDKPLFITGIPGCGKSTLANQLVKDHHVVPIHSDHIKYGDNLIDMTQNNLFRKDVLMMCSRNPYKALLIDDVQLFIRYDKSGLSKLINFVKTLHSRYPVIIVSDKVSHKLTDIIQSISYSLQLSFSMKFYKTILKKEHIPETQLKQWIQQSDKNLHTLKLQVPHKNPIDKQYSTSEVIQLLFTHKITTTDLLRLCSSEYTSLSLNILENAPSIINPHDIGILTKVCASICTSDSMESKYIDKDIEIDTFILLSCVIPRNYLYPCVSYTKNYKFIYNSYISKSLVQIHNQSLLSSIDYMTILDMVYKHQSKDMTHEIKEKISFSEFDSRVLTKQIKVYNYYLKTDLTRRQVDKTLEAIV